MTLDIITEFLLGQSVSSQNPSIRPELGENGDTLAQDIEAFGASQDAAAHWVYKAAYLGRFYRILPQRQFKAHRARLRRVVDWYAGKAIEGQSETKEKTGKGNRFVLLDEMAQLTSDKSVLRNETINVLTGGRSTSAATFGWLFYYLARYPAVYETLRSAVLEEFGTSIDPEHTNTASLRTCKYLQYCIEETLRLGCPAPMTVRKAIRDTTLPRGGGADGEAPIFVAKGTKVISNFFLSNRRQDIWGSDAEEFKPERWEHREHNWEFTPFGGGPRACIAQQMIKIQVAYIMVFLVQLYDRLEPLDGDCAYKKRRKERREERRKERQKEREKERRRKRQEERQEERQKERQEERKKERQKERQKERKERNYGGGLRGDYEGKKTTKEKAITQKGNYGDEGLSTSKDGEGKKRLTHEDEARRRSIEGRVKRKGRPERMADMAGIGSTKHEDERRQRQREAMDEGDGRRGWTKANTKQGDKG
ncbi:MAG: hypothetical protein L6R38_007628 [Xanthoria sp. 2 TBL-2021]|nr:MAG: hypothetical protein L6R38_007628 [Xanthoria sp. 2 TBL-2021]